MAAEAGMDSCPSPEISDSRKRPLDGDTENGTTKKSNYGGCTVYHFKILIPSLAAGAIIGKGGDTIAQLQKDTGAKINMSKSNDYYPVLVPNSTAGMIIGKGGNYITQIKDESGAYVQLSQKAKDNVLPERCITIIGDVNCCEKACEMIIAKIVEDPLSGSCLCTSYAHFTGPVANNSPTGSPFASLGWHRPSGSFGSTASLNSGGSMYILYFISNRA
ncbi:RNA-binding protein Nova-1 [Blattella germanica]|nr:RNA-binding protein Nova-1 [Blattella germanica]